MVGVVRVVGSCGEWCGVMHSDGSGGEWSAWSGTCWKMSIHTHYRTVVYSRNTRALPKITSLPSLPSSENNIITIITVIRK